MSRASFPPSTLQNSSWVKKTETFQTAVILKHGFSRTYFKTPFGQAKLLILWALDRVFETSSNRMGEVIVATNHGHTVRGRIVGHSEVETPAGVKFSTYGLPVVRPGSQLRDANRWPTSWKSESKSAGRCLARHHSAIRTREAYVARTSPSQRRMDSVDDEHEDTRRGEQRGVEVPG